MKQQTKQPPMEKPASLRILQYIIYLQAAYAAFFILLSFLFLWIPGDSGSAWGNFKANVLNAAFGIAPQEYNAMHVTYFSGIAGLTIVFLIILTIGIKRQIFLLCVIMSIVIIVLNLGNPLVLALSALMVLLLIASPNARKYLNAGTVEKTGVKD